jgi:hypothetical protein
MRQYRTLRGWLSGDEPDEEPHFAYSASLRITGESLDFAAITSALGLEPTHQHRRGEPSKGAAPWPHDMWGFTADLPEERPLHEHIDLLWSQVRHAKSFLLDLKREAKVDVFLGYRSNIDMAGVEVPASSLELFTELQIPFGLSIVIA